MAHIPLDILNNLESLLGDSLHVPAAQGMLSEEFLFLQVSPWTKLYVYIGRTAHGSFQ